MTLFLIEINLYEEVWAKDRENVPQINQIGH